MLGYISKLFGGNKSEKDVKAIGPIVEQINQHSSLCQPLTNDQLRDKTNEFKNRIKEHLIQLDNQIADLNKKAEALAFSDIGEKDRIYNEIDQLKKDRDKKIEEILKQLHHIQHALLRRVAENVARCNK